MKATILKISGLFIFLLAVISASAQDRAMISGKIISTEKETVDFATVYLKGTTYGGTTNEQGIYHLKAPAGDYTLVVSAIGYKTVEKPVKLTGGERTRQNITITPQSTELDEVVVVSNGISRLKRSAFNAVALDTKELQNSNKSLSEALAKAPGMKVRESGGVGSDMQLTLDGFSGKHVKTIVLAFSFIYLFLIIYTSSFGFFMKYSSRAKRSSPSLSVCRSFSFLLLISISFW